MAGLERIIVTFCGPYGLRPFVGTDIKRLVAASGGHDQMRLFLVKQQSPHMEVSDFCPPFQSLFILKITSPSSAL